MTEPWPCRCGCYRAGAQETAEATYADNLEPAARRTYRVSPFEGVTVVRWADDDMSTRSVRPEITFPVLSPAFAPPCNCRAKGQPMTPFGVHHLADCPWLAEFCCGGSAGDDEPHIIRGTE